MMAFHFGLHFSTSNDQLLISSEYLPSILDLIILLRNVYFSCHIN